MVSLIRTLTILKTISFVYTKSKILLLAALLPISLIAQNPVWTYQIPTQEEVGISYHFNTSSSVYGVLEWYNNSLDVQEYFLFKANDFGVEYDSIIQGYDSVFKIVSNVDINEYNENFLFFQRYESGSIFQDTIYSLDLEISTFTEDTLPFHNVNTFTEDSTYYYFIDNLDHNLYYTLNKSTEMLVDSIVIKPDFNGYKTLTSSGQKIHSVSGMHPIYNGIKIRVIDKDSLGTYMHDTIESNLSNEVPHQVFRTKASGALLITNGNQYSHRVIHIDSAGNNNLRGVYTYLSAIPLKNGKFFLRSDSNSFPLKYAMFHLLDSSGQELNREIIDISSLVSNHNKPQLLEESETGDLLAVVRYNASIGDSSFVILFNKNLKEYYRLRLPFIQGVLSFNTKGFLLLHKGFLAYYTHNLSSSDYIQALNEIYPNPVQDFLNLTKLKLGETYRIISINGQTVLSGNIDKNYINVSSLKSGVYILNCEGTGYKFIKQ